MKPEEKKRYPFYERLMLKMGDDEMYSREFSASGNVTWTLVVSFKIVDRYHIKCIGRVLWQRIKVKKGRLEIKFMLVNLNSYEEKVSNISEEVGRNDRSVGMSPEIDFGTTRKPVTLDLGIAWGCSWCSYTMPGRTLRDPDHLANKLQELHLSQKHTDMVFEVDWEDIPAHRLIVSAMSRVFSMMLEHDSEENRTGRVKVEDANAGVFKEMLRCLYTGLQPEWTSIDGVDADKLVMDLAYLAHKYELQNVLAHCEDRIVDTMTVQNVCQTLKVASALGLVGVRDCIHRFIHYNKELLETVQWKELQQEHPHIALEALRSTILTFR